MAVPTETHKKTEYTGMQVCEVLRRAVVMTANLAPDHDQLAPLIEFSITSKFRDALVWLTEEEDMDRIMHLVKMCLINQHLELDEVLALWRKPFGKTREVYRDRMTNQYYRKPKR
jgi:PHP family Zn ribbon phosphoesterase